MKNHHLVTRLTENSDYYTFDAQVRLDFNATDQDGNPVWDAKDIVLSVDKLRSNDPAVRENAYEELILTGNYLPPEGDFSAIIIDALDGDDVVTVGPTVQKSVWVDAGPGDDRVQYLPGSPILSDLADQTVRNDDREDAYPLGPRSAGRGGRRPGVRRPAVVPVEGGHLVAGDRERGRGGHAWTCGSPGSTPR